MIFIKICVVYYLILCKMQFTRVFFTRGIFHEPPCLLQAWWNKLVTNWFDKFAAALFQQACAKLLASLLQVVGKLATSLWSTALLQHWHNSIATSLSTSRHKSITTTCYKECEDILLTSCWNSIGTSLLQVCYKLCVFTRVLFTSLPIHWYPPRKICVLIYIKDVTLSPSAAQMKCLWLYAIWATILKVDMN